MVTQTPTIAETYAEQLRSERAHSARVIAAACELSDAALDAVERPGYRTHDEIIERLSAAINGLALAMDRERHEKVKS